MLYIIALVAFYICIDWMQNNLISQAVAMEAHVIPDDVMPALNQIACTNFGPFIQPVMCPFHQRRNTSFRPTTKISLSFAFVALSMLYSTVVQQLICTAGTCYKYPTGCADAPFEAKGTAVVMFTNHVNVWVQAPVYICITSSRIFAHVTGLEYAHDNSPHGLKVVVHCQLTHDCRGICRRAGALLLCSRTPI